MHAHWPLRCPASASSPGPGVTVPEHEKARLPMKEGGLEKVPRPEWKKPTGASTTARATGAEILETYGGAGGGGGTDPAAGRTAGLAADLTAERAMLDGREVERLA